MEILHGQAPERVWHYFEEISAIPRGSGNEAGIADYLEAFARAHGLESYRDALHNVMIYKPASAGCEAAAPLMLQGHTDIVCEKNAEVAHDFLRDPIRLQVVDGYDWNDRVPEWNDEGTMTNEEKVLITQSIKEVGQVMSNYVGIVRSDLRLKRAWDRLDLLYEETEALFKRVKATKDICELRNMINVGYLITRQAIERKESRGLHYTIDYPKHAYDLEK